MKLICPECKNEVDLSSYQEVKDGIVVECNLCGITLMISKVEGEVVSADIIDEGK